LKVALPIPSFLPALGGAEVGLHNIAMQLVEKGHVPTVITSYKHVKQLKDNDWKLPYKVLAYPPKALTLRRTHPLVGRSLLNIYHRYLQTRYRFDFWHTTFGYPTGVSVVEFCRKYNIPHLVRCVGEDIQVNHDIGYGMRLDSGVDTDIRYWLPRADTLIAITDSVNEEYQKIGAENVLKIPNGVCVSRFEKHPVPDDLRRRLGIDSETFLFLAFGRNHPKKNFRQLIEAAQILKSTRKPPFAVVIAGAGVGNLQFEVEEQGVSDVVRLYEPAARAASTLVEVPDDNVIDCYKMANAFVMPSIVETFGIVLIEAMAAGLPVIAANSPGCRDVIENGKFGEIYDGSLDQLVAKMEGFLDGTISLEGLSALGQQHVQQFDWSTVVDRYVNLYQGR
tara:strand:- start:39433 stop:40611 length:1179 start_codon:yes stop_codon:yes gene_type:complete